MLTIFLTVAGVLAAVVVAASIIDVRRRLQAKE
jgi:hypothetical protein